MNKFKCSFLGILLFTSAFAFAAIVPPELPGPPALMSDNVDDPSEEKIACGDLVQEMQNLRDLHLENGEAIAGFIETLGTHMGDWMKVFFQLAGKTVTFKSDYFEPIEETKEVADEISGLVWENTDQLDIRMEMIQQSIEVCL